MHREEGAGALRGTLEEENIIMTKRQLALAVAIAAIGTNAVWMNGVSAAEKQDVHGGGNGCRRYL